MSQKFFFPGSTEDEKQQFCPDGWIPKEIGMIVNRDREQRPFIKFVRLAKAFKRAKKEGRGQAVREKIETVREENPNAQG